MFSSSKALFAKRYGYQIKNSLRFRSSASAYLSRTPSVAGNRRTWTWSGWVKKTDIASRSGLFSAGSSGGSPTYTETVLQFESDNSLLFFSEAYTSTWVYECNFITSIKYRDPSAWMHVIVAVDTTQSTDTNRVKIYVNGVQIPASGFSTASYPALNADLWINTTRQHVIGTNWNSGVLPSAEMMDGYLAEVNFIDGQALTPSSFGTNDPATGVWVAKQYTGTYGTNGFYLPFSDTSGATATTIGKDSSGNGNNWTPNNIVVTAGTTCDAMIDAPNIYASSATQGVGNYATLNPLGGQGGTWLNGNLQYNGPTGTKTVLSTIEIPSIGKWYAEATLTGTALSYNVAADMYAQFGVAKTSKALTTGVYGTTEGLIVGDVGQLYNFSLTGTALGSKFVAGDVIGLAVDMSANTYTFYKNNSSISNGSINVTAGTPLSFCYCSYSSAYGQMALNFGQRPFTYTPPSGFKALNTSNLPTPTITNGAQYMAATLYTGTGASQSINNGTNTTLATTFQPDLVWGKKRSGAESHIWCDSVRGVSRFIYSDSTSQEGYAANYGTTSFNTNGFGVNLGAGMNELGSTYVAWQWNSGGAPTVDNTAGAGNVPTSGSVKINGANSTSALAGSIAATRLSANTSAGFSVVTYTGNGTTGATVGHGLGVIPSMVIVKERGNVNGWYVYHTSLGNTKCVYLDSTSAQATVSIWNNKTPTSSVIEYNNGVEVNRSSGTYVAYCFAPVAGYSAFGSYTGNGSADGPFVYTGFRPRFVLGKDSNGTNNWFIFDTTRDTYNVEGNILRPNIPDAELASPPRIDILSNGFKVRAAAVLPNDSSTTTYIYAAFAENPFKYSLAR